MSYGGPEGAARDDGWEELIRDPFIRSCVRGIQTWLRSLDRDEIDLRRDKSYYKITFGELRRPIAVQWYFHGGKTGSGYFIHFELPNATSDEVRKLKAGLSHIREQPYTRKQRRDDRFTFNVFNPADLELAKAAIVDRFNDWARANGTSHRAIVRPAGRIDTMSQALPSASPRPSAVPSSHERDATARQADAAAAPVAQRAGLTEQHPTGQGYEPSSVVRAAIENLAMRRAIQHFSRDGWSVEDVSQTESFDLRCTRPGAPALHVEVKGTRSEGLTIQLTTNEVAHARRQFPNIALYVLTRVRVVTDEAGGVSADGGIDAVILPWKLDEVRLRPVAFEYRIRE